MTLQRKVTSEPSDVIVADGLGCVERWRSERTQTGTMRDDTGTVTDRQTDRERERETDI